MFKKLFLALGLIFSINVKAATINDVIVSINQKIIFETNITAGFDWKVGDSAKYNLNAGFIKGSMAIAVKAITADLLTLSQDMDLGFAGKQACEMQINPNTGETKSMVCNGQNQQLPNKDDSEVTDMQDDTVTVPRRADDRSAHADTTSTGKQDQ